MYVPEFQVLFTIKKYEKIQRDKKKYIEKDLRLDQKKPRYIEKKHQKKRRDIILKETGM